MAQSQKPLDPSRHSIESFTSQLLSWKPFCKTLDSFDSPQTKPYSKRPCLSDRTTATSISTSISRLSLLDDDNSNNCTINPVVVSRGSLPLMAKKRRRRGSRSVSGRSCSDRSGTRRCCSVGAASDFPFAVGTDSSGELFGDAASWASDVSEAARNSSRKERERDRDCGGEKDVFGFGFGNDQQGNESGYGSEPGYRGDAEFGYGDEFDEEEEDAKLLFWGDNLGDSKMEMVGENTFTDQKSHYRCRRKKHDYRMVDSMR